MKLYCMKVYKDNKTTAGAKAPNDISVIAQEIGAKELIFRPAKKFRNIKVTRFFSIFTGLRNWLNLLISVEKNSLVIIQHPNENIMIANKLINLCRRAKKIKFIFLIHDLDSLRKNLMVGNGKLPVERGIIADEVLLKKADYIICHNAMMKEYLVKRGFDSNKIIELKIFDYLHNCDLHQKKSEHDSVIIAGNLMKAKAGYLYKLIEKNNLKFKINLYGPNYADKISNKNVRYYGQCSPEELPEKMEGSFGLVWDGTEIEGCHGNTGEYIKYNNPHKCSLFLASNIPVIVWKKAALASFVEENKVGITIDSLNEISDKLSKITDAEYDTLVSNAKKIGKQLRDGFYFKNALKEIMDRENYE